MSTATPPKKTTPMMQQWHSCKQVAKEAILLFRMGDFYEVFYEDAHILAEELDLTLTKRQEIPMAGVPWHTVENYIDRIVAKGYRVAIAEQTQDPKEAKGLVRREIVRFVTPGTTINALADKANNFITAIAQVGSLFGIASLDLSTGLFKVIEVEEERELLNELYRLRPSEIIVIPKFREKQGHLLNECGKMMVSIHEAWHFDHKTACNYLTDHFKTHHLDGFGLNGMVAAINSAGALLSYIHEKLSLPIDHIHEIHPYTTSDTLSIDRISQRNLELTESLQDGSRKNTLLSVIDQTQTAMGGRLIREWLKKPLLSVAKINQRQKSVETLYYQAEKRAHLRGCLKHVRDLERIMMRISSKIASPRDLQALCISLQKVPYIKEAITDLDAELLESCNEALVDLSQITELIKQALVDEPPARLSDGNIFRDGYDPTLDELRKMTHGGKEWLANYQTEIRQETGIKTLKVNFNKVFGYYLEVSKGQAHLMPESFQRRQTLVNSERFISPILKEYESKVLSAEERMAAIEQTLFQKLREKVLEEENRIFSLAHAIAQIDVLYSLAETAKKRDFVRPKLDLSEILSIQGGRHPVVEDVCGQEVFIPNETLLDGKTERLMLITGPNMAGKSTYIRQVALIVILAQMGSFVPAERTHIGIVDQIFTRIGASDDLSRGQSTFMVEMSETANILNNTTSRSLVILDEIGRGTSTYDGVSIAWAVAEYLLTAEGKQAKTLFATHYWELTELEKTIPGAVNYHAAVDERSSEILFLHKILKGGTDRSYGIHVARLAGLPSPVLNRAQEILTRLEAKKEQAKRGKKGRQETQLTLF